MERSIIVHDNIQRRSKYMLCRRIGTVASAAWDGNGWCKDEEAPFVGEDERPGQRKRRPRVLMGAAFWARFRQPSWRKWNSVSTIPSDRIST